ncbi:MAG: zf-HC2 domain-containing protein [Myxococcales bacterium]|nr:zf-HC2 domain-containing protein [Myxococcales bacterium]MCB9581798.1 zf-HC2 domain-containing protein [Polyangiaceae bacterium]
MSHVEAELIGYHFNALSPAARERVEHHLLACPRCCAALIALKRAIEVPDGAPSPAARTRLRRAVAQELKPRRRWETPLAVAVAACSVLALGAATRALTAGPGAPPYALSR